MPYRRRFGVVETTSSPADDKSSPASATSPADAASSVAQLIEANASAAAVDRAAIVVAVVIPDARC